MSQSEDIKAAARRALAPIAEDMLEVERIIMREVSSAVSRVDEVGHYITAAGGKRMRPALLILMARAMGADPAKAAYLGAVIEILHTATLMHDDVVDEGKCAAVAKQPTRAGVTARPYWSVTSSIHAPSR